MTDYIGQFAASAQQELADAIRDRIHLLRITGFRSESGLDPLSGHRYCAWVRSWRGTRSVLVVTLPDQETMAYQVAEDTGGHAEDVLVIDPDRPYWRTGGSFLHCTKQLLDHVAAEQGHFTRTTPAVNQPPHL
jgi:hypothetical protein